MKKLEIKKPSWQQVMMIAMTLIILTYAVHCILCHTVPYGVQSDNVNESLYKKLCYEQKTLFPKGFVTSNEGFSVRPVLVYFVFYAITHNFMLSYELECVTMLILTMMGLYWMMSELKVSFTSKLLSLCLLFLWSTFTTQTNFIFFYTNGYANFIFFLVIILALEIRLRNRIKNDRNLLSKQIYIPILILWILAVIIGYGSPRMLIVIYLPVLLLDSWRLFWNFINKRQSTYVEYTAFCVSALSAIVNMASYVLFCKFHGDSFNPLSMELADIYEFMSWDVLSTQIRNILCMCGLSAGGSLMNAYGVRFLLNCIIIFVTGISAIWSIKKEQDWVISCMVASVLISFAISTVEKNAALDLRPRYYFIIVLLVSVACALGLDRWAKIDNKKMKRIPFYFLTVCVLGIFASSAYMEEMRCAQEPDPYSLYGVAKYAEENNYQFVSGNYGVDEIPGYTNGRVFSIHANDTYDMSRSRWIIDTTLYDKQFENTPNLLLLTNEEERRILEANNDVTRLLNDYAEKVQVIGEWNLYALNENPYTLVEKINQRSTGGLPEEGIEQKVDYPNYNGFAYAHSSFNDMGELVSDGTEGCILWGPYSESVQGTYDITLHYVIDSYADDDSGLFDVALNAERQASVEFYADEQSATISGVVLSGGAAFEARVEVPAGMTVRVRSIEYKRTGE